mgnify:CR=1 FL=1
MSNLYIKEVFFVDICEPTHVIERIRQLYKINEGRLRPVPWVEEFSFKLNEIFTRLRIVGKDKTRGEMKNEIFNMTAVFKPHEESEKPRTVFIEGDPGMGKTTYCQKLAYDWATTQENWDEPFPIIDQLLLLRCQDIKSDIWEAIRDQLLPHEMDEESKSNFKKFILENQSKVLLVLDGLDEADQSKQELFVSLAQSKLLPNCLVLFTSRHESGKEVRRLCDTLWEIVGFAKKDAKSFIRKYFGKNKNLTERFLTEIRSRSDLRKLISNPLNTTLLCILCEDFREDFPASKAKLYIEITQCVLRRYKGKKGSPSPYESEDLMQVYEEDLLCLGKLALTSLLKGEPYIEGSAVTGGNTRALTKLGFLSLQAGGSRRKPCLRYGFLHKSFQEFFAGFYLASKVVAGDTDLDIDVTDARFLRELRHVFLFMGGVIVSKSEESAIHLLRDITEHANSLSLDTSCDGFKEVNRRVESACSFIRECAKYKKSLQPLLLREFGSHFEIVSSSLKKSRHLNLILENLSGNTTLTTLNLCEFVIRDSGAESLSKSLSDNSAITNLNLSFNNIGHDGAKFLSVGLRANTTLTILNLRGNEISDPGAASLAEGISGNRTLTNLNLGFNHISDSGATSLSKALSNNSTLTDLDLSANDIGITGATSLSKALSNNSTLTDLNLSDNDIGNTGATSLSEALSNNSTLTDLNLSANKIWNTGATSLSKALSNNSTLTDLNLSTNKIGNTGANSLSKALSNNSTLTDLNLSDNDIGNTGVKSLSKALRKNITLTNLDLGDNPIDNSGVVSLTGALSVNISLNLNLSGITFNYSHVPSHVQSRLSVTRHQENDGCADRDDRDDIFDDDSNSGNSSYSGETSSSESTGETCSSDDTSSSDDESPNSEDEFFINDADDDGEVSGEASGSDASQTSQSYDSFSRNDTCSNVDPSSGDNKSHSDNEEDEQSIGDAPSGETSDSS